MIFTSADVAAGAKAMQESRAWPVVFKAGSAAELARACLTAVAQTKEKDMSKETDRKKERSLDELIIEAQDLAKSRRIQTEEGRALANLCQRIIETMRHGEPSTPPVGEGSHHA